MDKHFQKTLLLCVSKYSLYNSLLDLLSELSEECKGYDVRGGINAFNQRVQTQMYRFPYKIRNNWEKSFLSKINRNIVNEFHSYHPDLVLVYNSEYLLPKTCELIKKSAKLIFFMGDSPFFTHTNNYYLPCLNYSDLILAPDTFWINQLNTLGIHQTSFFIPGLDGKSYYPVADENILKKIESLEILYTGASYVNSWGYKKALLMNQFAGFNFKLYGNSAWKRWFVFFPGLESVYNESGYIPTERLNKMFNKTKIIPVDGNPAILNGFHLRLFEALGAGALPLVEYRRDVDEFLFRGCDAKAPLIRDYRKAGDVAKYYLINESERIQLAQSLRKFIILEYNPARNSERLIMLLKKNKVI